MTKDQQFRVICAGLLHLGVKPTPKLLFQEFGFGNGRELGGKRSTIRIEEFERAGWIKVDGKWRYDQLTHFNLLSLPRQHVL